MKELWKGLIRLGAITAVQVVGAKYGENAGKTADFAVEVIEKAIRDHREKVGRDPSEEELLDLVHNMQVIPVDVLIARGMAKAGGTAGAGSAAPAVSGGGEQEPGEG